MKKIFKKSFALLIALSISMGSLPFSHAEEGNVLRVMDTTAGKPALITATGTPGEVIELTISNPFNSMVTQQFQLSEEGVVQYWYPQAVISGEYLVTYKDQEAVFSVSPGLPDPKKSKLELSDYTSYVGKAIEGQLTLKDHYGNRVSYREIELQSNGLTQLNCLNKCRTDEKGQLQFSIVSSKEGLKKLTVLDKEYQLKIFQEDLGFIPRVQQPLVANYPYGQNYFNPYNYQVPQVQNIPSGYQELNPSSFQYLPFNDPTRATFNAQGNNDQLLNNAFLPSTWMGAQLLNEDLFLAQTSSTSTSSTSVAQAGSVQSLEIIFSNEPDAEFEESVTVPAQTALDIIVRAVDAQGNVVEGYTGEIEFELSSGGLVPNDYTFSEVDKGQALFELALVLPVGDYTLTVQDKDQATVSGEVEITSQFQGLPNLNNTNIQLKIDSPVANSVYAKDFSVTGTTNTENTEIIVKEGALELKRGQVDQNKRFNFILDLSDGNHSLDIIAVYLPDGSETQTTIPIEVDKTPPVITEVKVQEEPVKAGETFTITAVAEERSKVQVFINNRSYDLVSQGGQNYKLEANAPLDPGSFAVHARATDEMGNVADAPDVGTLTVLPGLQEIANFFGIPGIGTATLSWSPVEGAAEYEISYRSILGAGQQSYTSTEPRITIENLAPNLSYIFTLVAKDADGKLVSKETQSKAIKVLEAPQTSAPVVEPKQTIEMPETDLKPAAETMPVRHTKSGPEVYLLILASLVVLNLYGRARKALVQTD